MIQYAVFASGSGSDLQSAINAEKQGRIPNGKIALVVSNNPEAKALTRAKKAGIAALYINHALPQEQVDKEIINALKLYKINFIFLAGYLKKISPKLLTVCPVYNIHPALDLHRFGGAGFYGMRVHEAVIAAKEKVSGATMHEVNAEYDRGAVLMQSRKVKIKPADTAQTLQERVLVEEHRLIPIFLKKITNKMLVR